MNSPFFSGEKQTNLAKPFSPYSIQKCPETQIYPKFCSSDCFGGTQSGQKIVKDCQNLSENYGFSNFYNFLQIFDPLTGTPQNNRWDKFGTNLGLGAVLKAVRGKRFCKTNPQQIGVENQPLFWDHEVGPLSIEVCFTIEVPL